MKPLFLTLLALPLAGCNLEALEGKPSPYKAAHEQRMALVTPVVANETPNSETQAALLLMGKTEPEPTCEIIWRIQNCDGNNPIPWSM